MKISRLLRMVREIHPKSVVIILDYNKFRIYNEDAYISYYLFKYDLHYMKYYNFIINKIEYLNYVRFNLKKLNINFIVLDKHDGYNVLSKYECDNNQYLTFLKRSKIYYKRMKIINKIRKLKDIDKIKLIKEKIVSYG